MATTGPAVRPRGEARFESEDCALAFDFSGTLVQVDQEGCAAAKDIGFADAYARR